MYKKNNNIIESILFIYLFIKLSFEVVWNGWHGNQYIYNNLRLRYMGN
jgi:hypothetical protein